MRKGASGGRDAAEMADDAAALSEADRNVEIWKVKKLIKSLEAARGCVTPRATVAARPGAGLSAGRG